MEIGDKVRFLNDVGGGRVSGFQGKDIVLVEDEDGFDIPVPVGEVVVVNDEKPRAPRPVAVGPKPKRVLSDDEDYDPSERPITFKPKPVERANANLLNVYLGFLESEQQEGVDETDRLFDLYLVNDCNYRLDLVLLWAEGANWRVRFRATVEPNKKKFVETIKRSGLPQMEHLCLQLLAYKEQTPFLLKPALAVRLRLDQVKFYKMSAFQPSPFFRRPAYVVDVVRDDSPVRQVFPDAKVMEEALLPKPADTSPAREPKSKADKKEPVVVDLHIDQLLDDTTNLSPADLLGVQMKKFHATMAEHIKHTGRKLIFIHGKGNGVLRKQILEALKYRYKTCRAQDASFQEYGYGATQVTVK